MILIFEKIAKVFANNGDPDQTPRSVASDLSLHCLPFIFWVCRLKWIKSGAFNHLQLPAEISRNFKLIYILPRRQELLFRAYHLRRR